MPSIREAIDSIRALMAANDFASAELEAGEALSAYPESWQLLLLKGELLEKHADASDVLDYYREVAARFPDQNSPQLNLLRVAFAAGEMAEALRCGEAILEKSPDNVFALVRVAAAAERLGDVDRLLRYRRRLVAVSPDEPRFVTSLVHSLSVHGAASEAVEVFRRALERGVANTGLYQMVQQLRFPADVVDRVMEWALSVGADAPVEERRAAASVLVHFGRIQRALEIEEEDSERYRSMIAWLDKVPDESLAKRPVVRETGQGEEIVVPAPGSSIATILFSGFGNQLGAPIELFDRFIAPFNVSAIYLWDSSRLLYNRGIPSIAGTYEGMLAHLKMRLAELGAERLVCIGSSIGGYAAIRYGLDLGAEAIVGLGAPTNLTPGFLGGNGQSRSVARWIHSQLGEDFELRGQVRAAAGRTPIHLYYGDGSRPDTLQARYLEGEPGVVLHPLKGFNEHAVFGRIVMEGQAPEFFRGLFGGEGK